MTSPPQSNLGRACRCRTTTQPSPHWLQRDALNSPPNLPFHFDNHLNLVHPSLDRLHSPPQTASGSNRPFCHNTLSGQTDRQIDRRDGRQTCTKSAYTHALRILNDALINRNISPVITGSLSINIASVSADGEDLGPHFRKFLGRS